MKFKRSFYSFLVINLAFTMGFAQEVPQFIHYQGNLASANGNPVNDALNMTFRIFDAESGGTALWEETQQAVQIEDGLFAVQLGSVTAFPTDLFSGERYLEIEIDSETLSPRQRIGSVAFALASENTQNVRGIFVDESNNVGIGTQNPQYLVHAVTQSSGFLSERIVDVGNGPYVSFRRARGPVDSPQPLLEGDLLGQITWNGFHPNDGYLGVVGPAEAAIYARIEGNVSANSMPTSLYFSTKGANQGGNVTRMIIRFDGNVGIGTTAPDNILTVAQSSATNPIADAWTQYSSRRWKTNIKTIEGALEKVRRLRGVTYNWKTNGKHDIGLIAEEVGEVIPAVVVYEANGKDARSVDYPRLVAVLIEAVKEQNKMIFDLKDEITEFDSLKAKMTQLEVSFAKLLAAQNKTDKTNPNLSKVAYQSR